MISYRFAGITADIADHVRSHLSSPQYGHPVHVERATGYGPCRVCLDTFREGEEDRILFTYQPFADPAALPSPGPIYIHRESCPRFDAPMVPPALRRLPLVLEGYGPQGSLVRQERVGAREPGGLLDELFEDARLEYAHVRNAEAGCFIARVERVFVCG
ncbi:MAG: DUF1203 domain-containing protein [Gemmatimonadales bacterium]|nr:DUF1203 domain-containing protein [Gemmatimonadales bacterium]